MSRVDTHHHVVHPEYAAWLTAKGQAAGGLPIRRTRVSVAAAVGQLAALAYAPAAMQERELLTGVDAALLDGSGARCG